MMGNSVKSCFSVMQEAICSLWYAEAEGVQDTFNNHHLKLDGVKNYHGDQFEKSKNKYPG